MALMKINSTCRVCQTEFHRAASRLGKTAYCSDECYRNRGTSIVPVCHPEEEHAAFGLCHKCYQQKYVSENREEVRNKKRSYRQKNPKRTLNEYLKYEYNLSIEEWDKLVQEQCGLCAICGGPPKVPKHRLNVDHDHSTGRVRGLLCGSCNSGLGHFLDNTELLLKAAQYLKLHDSIQNSGV